MVIADLHTGKLLIAEAIMENLIVNWWLKSLEGLGTGGLHHTLRSLVAP